MFVSNKLVHGIILGDVDTIAAQYISYCKAVKEDADTNNNTQDEEYEENEREQLLYYGVPFENFTLVCINGTALLYESKDATSNLNVNKFDETYHAWALRRLDDEAAATLRNSLNKAAEALTGPTQLKPLMTLSLVLAFD